MPRRPSRLLLLPVTCLLLALAFLPRRADAEGAVVAAHPLAAEAGAQMLREGGSAADAALAAALVLAVVEPQASGLGGGGFALVRGADGTCETLDFRETAPGGLKPEVYFDPADTLHARRSQGGTAVAVPGTPAGLALLHQRHGRLPLERLVRPALQLARDGYPVSHTLAGLIAERAGIFLTDSTFASLFLLDGLPPMEGDTLRNPGLASALEAIQQGGFSAYTEAWAEGLARATREAGGWLEASELMGYQPLVRGVIEQDWRGYRLVGPPPPATGALAAMEALTIVEPLALDGLDEAQRIHVLGEALRKALRDRALRGADPAFHRTPVDSLLDRAAARAVLAAIHPDGIHAVWPGPGSRPFWEEPVAAPGHGPRDKGNTTHISVWDAEGRMVSLTHSLNYFFGAGVAWRGVLLNNQIDDFSWEPGSVNAPEPGKRPRSSMAPLFVLRDGKPLLCLGTPGGARIPSTMTQILVNHLQLGQPLQEAIDAPRWYPAGTTLVLEPRLAPESGPALEAIGYRLYPMQPLDSYFGGAHGIARLTDGRLEGAADPRRDGRAVVLP